MVLSGAPGMPQEDPEPEWETGTFMDGYNAVYRAMAAPTKRRAAFAPDQVDAMDIATVAVLLGIGTDPGAADRAELAQIAARRKAGDTTATWDAEGFDFDAMRRPA